MANKNLFKSASARPAVPVADTRNAAGGRAYSLAADEALAQFAVTGSIGGTFYASAQSELDSVLALAKECSDETLADVAIYARKQAYMKDMPSLLLAVLAGRKSESATRALSRAFPKVCDNGKMIRNFAQMIRSGKFGRKSFGAVPKRLIRQWFEASSPERIYRDSVGNDPSLADVVKLVHPKADSKQKDALFGFLTDSKRLTDAKRKFLPTLVKSMALYQKGDGPMPTDAPFMMLTAHAKSEEDWMRLVQRASWTETRINLAAFNRHGVFKPEHDGVARMVANRLRDPEAIRRAKVFPYQLFTAYLHTTDVPPDVRNALQDALEVATENVPDYSALVGGKTVVAVDVSGSMDAPVTGNRGSATSKVSCKQVAALLASSILRSNRSARVMPFTVSVHETPLNPRDSVATNASKLSALPSGGTDCSAVLRQLNAERATDIGLVVMASDNESWRQRSGNGATDTMTEWARLKARNPKAKLVCIDLAANGTAQVPGSKDRLNVGGFSDTVFSVIKNFLEGQDSFLDTIRTSATGSDLTNADE